MSNVTKGFADWACDSRRTLEEKFGAELLMEHTLDLWNKKHQIEVTRNYQAERLRQEARQKNLGYLPVFTREQAERCEEVLPELTRFNVGYTNDRPLRDLSFLQFCPLMESMELRSTEIRDWSWLAGQTALKNLHIGHDPVARDFRVLEKLTALETLYLYLNMPWPDVRGLEKLTALTELHYTGNSLALREVPVLPNVRRFLLSKSYFSSVPLKSPLDLPAMPEVRRMKLDHTLDLDGIERYAKLVNLELYGYYTDLTPLTELKELTHLELHGKNYESLAPLSKLPKLLDLTVQQEVPPDFTPLADAPQLREVKMKGTHIVPAELASLNAMFEPWDELFMLPVPRPLAPLRLIHRKFMGNDATGETINAAQQRDFGENHGLNESESSWFVREANRRLKALLAKGGGTKPQPRLVINSHSVSITHPEHIERVVEIANCLRELMAATKYKWQLMFIVDSLDRYERNVEDIYEEEGEEFDVEESREAWKDEQRRRKEYRESLELKYRHRLQQDLGTPGAPIKPPTPELEAEEEDEDTLDTTAEEEES